MSERCFPALRHSTVEKFCYTLEPAALRSEPQKGQRGLKYYREEGESKETVTGQK